MNEYFSPRIFLTVLLSALLHWLFLTNYKDFAVPQRGSMKQQVMNATLTSKSTDKVTLGNPINPIDAYPAKRIAKEAVKTPKIAARTKIAPNLEPEIEQQALPLNEPTTLNIGLQTYYSVDEVERKAQRVSELNLDAFPALEGLTGIVQFDIYIDQSGQVQHVEFIDTQFATPEFLKVVKVAVMQQKFIPATIGDTNVNSRMRIEVESSRSVDVTPKKTLRIED